MVRVSPSFMVERDFSIESMAGGSQKGNGGFKYEDRTWQHQIDDSLGINVPNEGNPEIFSC